jgi:uncharacterized protein (DUF1697 family)
MRTYVALLRAVNVGGTGMLPMNELKALCERAGFTSPQTYIQSGNVIFESRSTERQVKSTLEKALAVRIGRPAAALVRRPTELARVVARNPFARANPRLVIVFFLDEPASPVALKRLVVPAQEEVVARGREVFVHYPAGQGHSRLKLPFARIGTGRNLNTVSKLLDLARKRALAGDEWSVR